MEDWRERLVEIIKQWGLVVAVGIVGISLVGYGLYQAVRPSGSFGWAQDKAVVEVIKGEARCA